MQRHPMLWSVENRDRRNPAYCGPTAVSALTGAYADEVVDLIKQRRGDDRPVQGTSPEELQHAFHQFGYDLLYVANLAANNPPSLARWERERTDADFEQSWLLIVDNHWVAVRGWWICDSLYTRSVPVRIRKTGPHRLTRVNYVYRAVTVAPNRVPRDNLTGRIIRSV